MTTKTKGTDWKDEATELLARGTTPSSFGHEGKFRINHGNRRLILEMLQGNLIQRENIGKMRRKKGTATQTIEERLKGIFGGG